MDSAVRGAKGVVSILNTAPLAVIPYLASDVDISRLSKRRLLTIAGIIGGIVLVLLLIHFLYSPLDVLWFRGLRKMGNIVAVRLLQNETVQFIHPQIHDGHRNPQNPRNDAK
jgi:hypothetical protein